MDEVMFYQPDKTFSSHPPPLPSVFTTLVVSGQSITSPSVCQTASQLNQQNGISKDQMNKSRDVSGPSQKSHASDWRCRNDTVQEQDLTATRNAPKTDDDDVFPDIDELLSDIRQKRMLASVDPNSDDDDGFIDIDELLSGMQQKSVPASADSNSGGMAEMVHNGTRGGSPTDSSRSTAGSSQDPILLSNNEYAGAESETDCSALDVDVRAKSDSDGDRFGSGAAVISDRLVTDHQEDNNNHNKGVVDKTQLRLSVGPPISASPDSGSDTHQASKLQVDTDIMQESMSSVDLDVTKEWEDEGFDASPEGADKDDGDNCSTKGRTLSAFSNKKPDDIQSKQLALAAASPHQSDLKNGHLAEKLRRGATRNVRSKRPRPTASIGLASAARTASASLESSPEPQPRARITGPDQEMADDGSDDDSDDEYYDNMSNAAGSKRGGRPRSRKRARRMKDTEGNDVEAPPTHSVGVSYPAAAATSSASTQESDEIPIHGYLTLKTIESKVVYCLTFSQELLPCPQHQGQRQESTTDLEEPQSVVPDPGICQAPLRGQTPRRPWTREEDATLRKMKKKGNSWEEIHAALPHRSKGTLQVRYSTKLKGRC